MWYRRKYSIGQAWVLDLRQRLLVHARKEPEVGVDVGLARLAAQVARVGLDPVVERGRDGGRHPQPARAEVLHDDRAGRADLAAHVGDRGEARLGPLRVVIDHHVREAPRRQRVVPLFRLRVDHGDEVVLVEDHARDGEDRELQHAHHRAVLGTADDAAIGHDRRHARRVLEDVGQRDRRRERVRVGVVVREDERLVVPPRVLHQAIELHALRVARLRAQDGHPRRPEERRGASALGRCDVGTGADMFSGVERSPEQSRFSLNRSSVSRKAGTSVKRAVVDEAARRGPGPMCPCADVLVAVDPAAPRLLAVVQVECLDPGEPDAAVELLEGGVVPLAAW